MENQTEQLISEYMGKSGTWNENIGQLWPVLGKIHKECKNSQDQQHLQVWLVIAAGLYSIDFFMIYNAVVSYIKFHNTLKTMKQ